MAMEHVLVHDIALRCHGNTPSRRIQIIFHCLLILRPFHILYRGMPLPRP